MALVKYGAVVTEIKGKVGGTVFQSGVAGYIVGNMAKMSRSSVRLGKQNRSTGEKFIQQHRNLSDMASAWKLLSSTQRAAWNAAAVNFPFTNAFGELYTASGYQLFMSVNINLLSVQIAALDSPPSPQTLHPTPLFDVAAGSGTDYFQITSSVQADTATIFYASAQCSPGLDYSKSRMKAIAMFTGGTSFPYSVTAAYTAVFGAPPAAGNVWFEAVSKSTISGQICPSYILRYEYGV